ncbi:MAG: DUF4277 domain-containing protein [Trichodesmium erythraeum GBRTRLIN201]|uniref:DUF4277 domain-containing protein n=1 Tax=Trichodesmium erythraeum TaxID=1206 RepID=UPI0000392D52|nr:DUF4277 domain-containing protein [Trichodesmium erythraeum GBRTRLIN201]
MLYDLIGINALSNLSCFKARLRFSILRQFLLNLTYFHLFTNNSNIKRMSLSEEIKVKNIHHLGILAGLIDEMGIVEIINQKLGIDSKKKIISGQVIVTIKFPRIGKKNSSDKEIIK